MKIVTRLVCLVLVLVPSLVARADEYEAVTKQLAKINAMSTDQNGRRVISRLIATRFQVHHANVLTIRREFNLNYGSTFLFFHLAANGINYGKLKSELAAGKNLKQVGNEQSVDWKKISSQAKDFNKKVRDQLYRYFINETEIRAQDTAENYIPILDTVPADSEGYTPEDVDQAQDVFQRQRLRASAQDPQNRSLDRMNENQIRHSHDKVHDNVPQLPPMAPRN